MNSIGIQRNNWLLHNGKPCQIDSIIPDAMIRVQHSDHWATANWNDLTPIELSPAILEAAGFERIKHIDGYVFHLLQKPMRIAIYERYTEVAGRPLPNKIEYVHQLQNLYYSLTSTELTITLP